MQKGVLIIISYRIFSRRQYVISSERCKNGGLIRSPRDFFPQRVRAIGGYMDNNVLILPGVLTYRKSVIWSGSCKMAY